MWWREVQLSRDSTGTTDPDGRDLREHRNTLFDDLLVFIIHNAVNAENDKLSICAFSCMGDIVERDAWTEVDAVEAALRHEDTANQRSKFVQTSIGRAGNDRHTAGAGARRGSLGEEDAFQDFGREVLLSDAHRPAVPVLPDFIHEWYHDFE